MSAYLDMKHSEKGAWASIVVYILLSAAKLAVGIWAGSEALKADGLNNATDIVVSVAVLIGIRISRRPPDDDHQYGHRRAETVSALVASLIMFAVGVQVLYEAGWHTFRPTTDSAPDPIAAWTALGCAVVTYALYTYNRRLAARTNSSALMAAAHDNRSDALVGFGTFIGIFGSRFGFPWLDPVTAAIVGVIICKTAWDIFQSATHALTDGFDDKQLEALKETVATTPGVELVHDLKARNHGNEVFVDVTVHVDRRITVEAGHDIAEEIERRLRKHHRIMHVHVHIEPGE